MLFLDELPEFGRAGLEALRLPIKTGKAVIARANVHVSYPARFPLVAATNPCCCGGLDDAAQACNRAPRCAADYQARISDPLFERIDMHIDVPAGSPADLALPPPPEGSAEIASRVLTGRTIQAGRYENAGIRTNAQAEGETLDVAATPDAEDRALLAEATEPLRLTAQGYGRIMRVARTIADLEGLEPRCPPAPSRRGAELPPHRAGALIQGLNSAIKHRLLAVLVVLLLVPAAPGFAADGLLPSPAHIWPRLLWTGW